MTAAPFTDGFADRLRKARERAGLTQRELAAEAGVNFSQVSRYEQGIAFPRPGLLIKIANALGVTAEHLRHGGDAGVTVEILGPTGDDVMSRFAITSDMADTLDAYAKQRGISPGEMLKIILVEAAQSLDSQMRADDASKRKR